MCPVSRETEQASTDAHGPGQRRDGVFGHAQDETRFTTCGVELPRQLHLTYRVTPVAECPAGTAFHRRHVHGGEGGCGADLVMRVGIGRRLQPGVRQPFRALNLRFEPQCERGRRDRPRHVFFGRLAGEGLECDSALDQQHFDPGKGCRRACGSRIGRVETGGLIQRNVGGREIEAVGLPERLRRHLAAGCGMQRRGREQSQHNSHPHPTTLRTTARHVIGRKGVKRSTNGSRPTRLPDRRARRDLSLRNRAVARILACINPVEIPRFS